MISQKKHQWRFLAFLAIAVATLLGLTSTAQAQLSGAIFTTDSTGTTVNGNLYAAKTDVYLDGGPQPNAPCTASGLPDGDYYFMVTDPSGKVLLSTDGNSPHPNDGIATVRIVHVSDGVIVSAVNHFTGTGKCTLAISVQLYPYLDTPNPGGEYKVWMTPVEQFMPFDESINDFPANTFFGFQPRWSKTDNFKAPPENGGGGGGSSISGTKFYDADLSGAQNGSEPGIPNWQITIDGTPVGFISFSTTTDFVGYYSFTSLVGGTYGVCEVLPQGGVSWVPTTPTGISGIVVPPDSTNNNFGNVCLGFGGGLTLGFWSNKNGQSLITGPFLCALNDLNLRNSTGANFDPVAGCPSPTTTQISAGKTALKNWLLSATATNMAYMLSAQLAAMDLNVLSGGVNGSANVFAGTPPPGCTVPGLSALGFISINNLITAANVDLGLNGLTKPGSPYRSCQEFKKNALDAGNNNQNFVQPSPCAVIYAGTETCTPQP